MLSNLFLSSSIHPTVCKLPPMLWIFPTIWCRQRINFTNFIDYLSLLLQSVVQAKQKGLEINRRVKQTHLCFARRRLLASRRWMRITFNYLFNIFFVFCCLSLQQQKATIFYITFFFYSIEGLLVWFGFIIFFLTQEEDHEEESTEEDGIWLFYFDNNKLKYINCFDALFTRNIL